MIDEAKKLRCTRPVDPDYGKLLAEGAHLSLSVMYLVNSKNSILGFTSDPAEFVDKAAASANSAPVNSERWLCLF